ncbi:hypothetical protein H4582DRAFT_2023891 [Lactarius indigo]|nr:hypothetical protein H4582DRAFT_2023891 [Lactarius indigo]
MSSRPTQVDPLYAFTLIRTFLNILIECFGEVTPLITAPNTLRNIVLPLSLISKIPSATGRSGPSGFCMNDLCAFSDPMQYYANTIDTQLAFKEWNRHHKQRSRKDRCCKLSGVANSVLPSLCLVRTHLPYLFPPVLRSD